MNLMKTELNNNIGIARAKHHYIVGSSTSKFYKKTHSKGFYVIMTGIYLRVC